MTIYDVLTANEYTDGQSGVIKTRFREIGTGFYKEETGNISVELDATPTNGRLILKVRKPEADAKTEN